MMKNRRNYYRILQVQPDAPFEVIRASYRALMRELKQHPDLGGDQWNAGILNEAYETLRDADKRAEYDKRLFETYIKKPFPDKDFKRKSVTSISCPFCKRPLARHTESGEGCPVCRSPLEPDGDHEAFNRLQRRSLWRIRRPGKLRYYYSRPEKAQTAEMIDISTGGVRFVCNEMLREESTIRLSSPLLKATARVTNYQEREVHGKICYAVGVQFLTVAFAKTKGAFISTLA
ncbi:MAG: DnaJ domain-containing protein [Deferribacteres bacterium]|nr:DnaJ domain-containing protein [Deferribacteres bacterium]